MSQRVGTQSVLLDPPPYLSATATVGGPMEGQGPLAGDMDRIYNRLLAGEKSFEAAELKMLEECCLLALGKGNLNVDEIDYFIAGDLLNQTISSGFSALKLSIPYLGVYGACSTLNLALSLGALLVAGGVAQHVMAATSSHNSSAERQYRYPTEYGFKRPPHAQWTVTGAGAGIISREGGGPKITAITTGKVVDLGVKDPLALGAAMAPAAASTLISHFQELERDPSYYDLILTGDLGQVGRQVYQEIMVREGYSLPRYHDCGTMIYNLERQPVDAGGSGCACIAVVALGHIYQRIRRGEFNRVLLVATGALHSPTTCLQGNSIPVIAHALALEN
ncbi:MAG: stage V sporulation protein AD [Firmicutes bacterium]|nr:stage V sporulation protein AD [Bacillota bacterium]